MTADELRTEALALPLDQRVDLARSILFDVLRLEQEIECYSSHRVKTAYRSLEQAEADKDAEDKIKLHAVFRKTGRLTVCDQFGREFDAQGREEVSMGAKAERVMTDLTLQAPYWPDAAPRAEIQFSIPLEVEERLPTYLADILQPRPGMAFLGWMS